jgi:hypothetical protein
VTASRLVYSGSVRLNGSDPERLEIWAGESAAVAFAGGVQRGVLTGLSLDLDADRRLRLTGLDPDGVPTVWQAEDEERVQTRWAGARISWPSGKVSTGASVTGTNHGVTIHADGAYTELPAARLTAVGSQRWVVDGDVRFLASDSRGCGCGSRKRR